MSCATDTCSPVIDGAPSGGGVISDRLIITRTTTDGAAQTLVIGSLPVVGASIFWEGTLNARLVAGGAGAGTAGAYVLNATRADRNAIGSGAFNVLGVGPTSYVDAALVPWSTVAFGAMPAGWAYAAPAVVANQLVIAFNGAAGQTIEWVFSAHRRLSGGATP